MSKPQLNLPKKRKQLIEVREWNLSNFYSSLHIHSDYQITYIERGNGTLCLGKNIISFNEGDIFLIGSNVPHLFVYPPKSDNTNLDVKAVSIFFPPKYSSKIFFGINELIPILTLLKQSASYVKVGKTRLNDITRSIKAMTNIKDGLTLILLLIEILHLISYDYETAPTKFIANKINEDKNASKIERVYEFTLNNYKRVIYLSEVASLVDMTDTAFCRFFMKMTGKTYMQFLVEIRVWMSCKLMVFTTSNLSDIAASVGFLSITNYIKQFKNVMNMTPSAYKSLLYQHLSID